MATHPQTLLARYGLAARKGLGQNFLVPGGAAERIVRAAQIAAGDWVVEIGPGLGALTAALLDAGAHVVAVELDPQMLRVLSQELGTRERLELVHADARGLDLGPIHARAGRRLKLAGNLPYYASSPLLRRAVEQREHVLDATFTLQREVAERVAAPPGSRTYGALSVLVGLWADASVPLKLPPGAFHPRPGVESAVLRLVMRRTPKAEVPDAASFERVVFAAFGQRRKTIWNSLRGARDLDASEERIADALRRAGIEPNRRAETVPVEAFAALARALAAG